VVNVPLTVARHVFGTEVAHFARSGEFLRRALKKQGREGGSLLTCLDTGLLTVSTAYQSFCIARIEGLMVSMHCKLPKPLMILGPFIHVLPLGFHCSDKPEMFFLRKA